jgi:hypothetical protein
MSDRRAAIVSALGRLERGTWSLTVHGFARRAIRQKELSASAAIELRRIMDGLGLPHRRVPIDGVLTDVWDYDAR